MKERSARRILVARLGVLVSCFVIFFLLVSSIKSPYNSYDEGLQSVAAQRILRGDAPYRDFWVVYPPGQFYMLAAVHKVFGDGVAVARMYDVFVRMFVMLAIFQFGRRLAPMGWVMGATMVAALLLGTYVIYNSGVTVALCIVLWALVALLAYADSGRLRWLWLSGLLIGAASVFRYDFAVYGAAAALGALGSAWLSWRICEAGQRDGFCESKPIALFAGVVALTVLVAYAVMGLRYGFGTVWAQIFVFPLTVLPPYRSLPAPALLAPLMALPTQMSEVKWFVLEMAQWAQLYVPLTIHLAGVALVVWIMSRRRAVSRADFALALVSLFGLLTMVYGSVRFDLYHTTPSMIIACLTLLLLLTRVEGLGAQPLRYGLVAGAMAFGLFAVVLPLRGVVVMVVRTPPWGCDTKLVQSDCVGVAQDQAEAVDFIREHTAPDERIFVGLARHDRIFVQDFAFYLFADRASATRYHYLEAGFATTEAVQREIVSDLEAQRTEWIVLFDSLNPNEPNLSAVSGGVYVLDEYIQAHYEAVTVFDRYEIVRRKAAL